jgi:hypothetical protein
MVAQIPPPMMSHTVPKIKKTRDMLGSLFRLAMPRIMNKMGGPNVIAKQIKTNTPIPSIVIRGIG